jgi:hypothetical protein
MRTAERNRLATSHQASRKSIEKIIKALQREIDDVEAMMGQACEQHYADLAALLESAKGIAQATSAMFIGALLHSLAPLFAVPDSVPVVDPSKPHTERRMHYYAGARRGSALSQLDYMFASKALHSTIIGLGFERRGIFEIDKAAAQECAEPVSPYTVTRSDESASDHAGLVAEFAL